MIKLPKCQLYKLEALLKQGYYMNSCDNQFITLLKEPIKKLGSYISTGAIILDDQNRVLLVQEKNGILQDLWGFPSGHVDQNESLVEATQREVYEEVGLDIQCEQLYYSRYVQYTKFNMPDLYFGFIAKQISTKDIKLCEVELMNYEWIKIGDLKDFFKSSRYTHSSGFGIRRLIKDQQVKQNDCNILYLIK